MQMLLMSSCIQHLTVYHVTKSKRIKHNWSGLFLLKLDDVQASQVSVSCYYYLLRCFLITLPQTKRHTEPVNMSGRIISEGVKWSVRQQRCVWVSKPAVITSNFQPLFYFNITVLDAGLQQWWRFVCWNELKESNSWSLCKLRSCLCNVSSKEQKHSEMRAVVSEENLLLQLMETSLTASESAGGLDIQVTKTSTVTPQHCDITATHSTPEGQLVRGRKLHQVVQWNSPQIAKNRN